MCFIDEFRLLGVANHLEVVSKRVILWDAAVLGDTRIPRQLVLDLGSQYRVLGSRNTRDAVACYLESNYNTPFCTDPSMRLVGIKVYRGKWSQRRSGVLLVRSQAISGFSSRIGTTSAIRWEDWSHFATPIRFQGLSNTKIHLLHSHLLCLHHSRTLDAPHLHVFDFSLECKRREGDSDAIGEFSEREIPVNEIFLDGKYYFSASNIILKSRIIHPPVSFTSLGTLLASSGLNATHPRH